jgi:hypothetical protein
LIDPDRSKRSVTGGAEASTYRVTHHVTVRAEGLAPHRVALAHVRAFILWSRSTPT